MPLLLKTLHSTYNNPPGSVMLFSVAAPASSAIVSNIRFYNRGNTSATTTVLLKLSSTDSAPRTLAKVTTNVGASEILQLEITLGTGNILEASTAGGNLDFALFGVERV